MRHSKEAGEQVTPYNYAKRLYATLAPDRKIDPKKSVYLGFRFDLSGIQAEGQKQRAFTSLLYPYRSLFSEHDIFTVSLSMDRPSSDISFKAEIWAAPPSPRFNHNKPYPIFAFHEIPQRGGGEYATPYNLLILREGERYSGKLDAELLDFDPAKGISVRRFTDWKEAAEGDVEWRKQFACGVLQLFTRIAELNREASVQYNQDQFLELDRQRRSMPWWKRFLQERVYPGAVLPESVALYIARTSYDAESFNRLVAHLQHA